VFGTVLHNLIWFNSDNYII